MKNENASYEFKSKFITAPDDYLSKLESEEYKYETNYPESKWIWPTANIRGHLTRRFELDFLPEDASFEFIYDNAFDLYINGNEIKAERFENMYRASSRNCADLLNLGTNRLAFRLYQTNDPNRFSSALKGGLTASNGDKTLTILTDKNFSAWLVCNFYEETEPDGWFCLDSQRQGMRLAASDIHPKYLRRSLIFKKSFICEKTISSARLYATAKGLYEAKLNGCLFDDARFLPGSKDKVTEYHVFDVTSAIKDGENEISVTLGNGWLNSESWGWLFDNKPALLCELEIKYADGSTETIGTDGYKIYPSPLTENDLQFGERYDARLEDIENDVDAYADAVPCEIKTHLCQATYPPIRITKEEKCVSIARLNDGAYLYDFGTNGTGRARINLKNTKRGERIKIRYAEYIKKDGRPHLGPYQEVYFPNDNKEGGIAEFAARNLDVYICRGDETESYLPRFTFTGFRYVYIEGYSGKYDETTVTRALMNTDLSEVGDIDTDNDDIASIWDVIKRTYRSNIFTGPTDCPTREKNFWNGDTQAFVTTACWYMDNKDFLSSWSLNGRKLQYGIYGWEDEEYIVPLVLYKFYGDIEVIRIKYPIVKALIEKRRATVPDGELFPPENFSPYRDWKSIENVSSAFHASLYYTFMFRSAARMAELLGLYGDMAEYLSEFEKLRSAFNERFYDKERCTYNQNCQGGLVLPIALGIAPEEDISRIVKALHGYVEKSDYHFTTGFMASEHILSVLADNGYEEDALKMLLCKSYPSILNMISTGATTTTENWEGVVEYDDIRAYDSFNHFAFGVFGRWLFEYLGGIRILECGFKKILLKPIPYREINRLKAKHRSPLGLIEAEISYDSELDEFTYSYSVPDGVEAYIELSGSEAKPITERCGKVRFKV